MTDNPPGENSIPKKQLETGRGGSGRKPRTAVGAGDGCDGVGPPFPGGPSPEIVWPEEPEFALPPSTVICERDPLLLAGLKAMIESFVTIVGEATDGIHATEMIRSRRPNLVILNIDLNVLNGVEVCRRVQSELPNVNSLVWTDTYHATKYYSQIIRAGARGICLQSSGPSILYEALKMVCRCLPYTDPAVMSLVRQVPTTNFPNPLTDREIEVLIRLDLRNKEISEELDMKLRTVEKHIECILAKLRVQTRTSAALKATACGLRLLPIAPTTDLITGKTREFEVSEMFAREALRRRKDFNPPAI